MAIPLILAPIIAKLATSGLDLLGSALLAKGKDFVEGQLGVDIESELQTEEGRLKLQELQLTHEAELLKLALEDRKVDLEFTQADNADRDSARKREVAMADQPDSNWLNKNLVPILALTIVLGGLATLYFHEDTEVRMAAVSMITMVLGYYFGSNSSSWKKDSTINALSKDKS